MTSPIILLPSSPLTDEENNAVRTALTVFAQEDRPVSVDGDRMGSEFEIYASEGRKVGAIIRHLEDDRRVAIATHCLDTFSDAQDAIAAAKALVGRLILPTNDELSRFPSEDAITKAITIACYNVSQNGNGEHWGVSIFGSNPPCIKKFPAAGAPGHVTHETEIPASLEGLEAMSVCMISRTTRGIILHARDLDDMLFDFHEDPVGEMHSIATLRELRSSVHEIIQNHRGGKSS